MRRMYCIIMVISFLFSTSFVYGNSKQKAFTYYVSVNGKETNFGTLASPLSLQAAVGKAKAGDTIIVKGGTYTNGFTMFNKNGTKISHITIRNYKTERPLINSGYIRVNNCCKRQIQPIFKLVF